MRKVSDLRLEALVRINRCMEKHSEILYLKQSVKDYGKVVRIMKDSCWKFGFC